MDKNKKIKMGLLPNDQWLIDHGMEGMIKEMKKHPELFEGMVQEELIKCDGESSPHKLNSTNIKGVLSMKDLKIVKEVSSKMFEVVKPTYYMDGGCHEITLIGDGNDCLKIICLVDYNEFYPAGSVVWEKDGVKMPDGTDYHGRFYHINDENDKECRNACRDDWYKFSEQIENDLWEHNVLLKAFKIDQAELEKLYTRHLSLRYDVTSQEIQSRTGWVSRGESLKYTGHDGVTIDVKLTGDDDVEYICSSEINYELEFIFYKKGL